MVHETLTAGCSPDTVSRMTDSWRPDQKQTLAMKKRSKTEIRVHRAGDRAGVVSDTCGKFFELLKTVNK